MIVLFGPRYVSLMLEPVSASEMTESLKQKSIYNLMESGERVAFLYMVQHSGESDCMPHCRTPRFRADHLRKLLAGALGERADIPSGFIAMCGVWARIQLGKCPD